MKQQRLRSARKQSLPGNRIAMDEVVPSLVQLVVDEAGQIVSGVPFQLGIVRDVNSLLDILVNVFDAIEVFVHEAKVRLALLGM
jgi:hypothetical protein